MVDSLPVNARSVINVESAASFSNHMTECRSNTAHCNAIVRFSAAKQFDEPGPAEARAVNKVLQLPQLSSTATT